MLGLKEGAAVDSVDALTGAAPVYGYVAAAGAAKHPRLSDTGATPGTTYPFRMEVFPQPHLTYFIVQQPDNRKIHASNNATRTALGLDMSLDLLPALRLVFHQSFPYTNTNFLRDFVNVFLMRCS
jgi:hypothetical protein